MYYLQGDLFCYLFSSYQNTSKRSTFFPDSIFILQNGRSGGTYKDT